MFERYGVVVYAKEVNIFFNVLSMSSRKKNTAEEKIPWITVKDVNYSLSVDFSQAIYKVRYLTPSMQLNLISWTTKEL